MITYDTQSLQKIIFESDDRRKLMKRPSPQSRTYRDSGQKIIIFLLRTSRLMHNKPFFKVRKKFSIIFGIITETN